MYSVCSPLCCIPPVVPALIGIPPVSKTSLAEFEFYSIEFMHDGIATIGFLNRDPEQDEFTIVYSAADGIAERREALLLTEELQQRVTFDAEKEILRLG